MCLNLIFILFWSYSNVKLDWRFAEVSDQDWLFKSFNIILEIDIYNDTTHSEYRKCLLRNQSNLDHVITKSMNIERYKNYWIKIKRFYNSLTCVGKNTESGWMCMNKSVLKSVLLHHILVKIPYILDKNPHCISASFSFLFLCVFFGWVPKYYFYFCFLIIFFFSYSFKPEYSDIGVLLASFSNFSLDKAAIVHFQKVSAASL